MKKIYEQFNGPAFIIKECKCIELNDAGFIEEWPDFTGRSLCTLSKTIGEITRFFDP